MASSSAAGLAPAASENVTLRSGHTGVTDHELTAVRRRGELLGADGKPSAAGSSWRIEVPSRDSTHTEAIVRELLDIVEPHTDGMASARRAFGLSAGIFVYADIYDRLSMPQVQFHTSTLRRLSALDLWFRCMQDYLV